MLENAVTWGRFTVLTHGHLAMVEEIMARWSRLAIGLLDLDTIPKDHDPHRHRVSRAFHEAILRKCDPVRNPFSIAERTAMWEAALDAAGHLDRVTVLPVPVPEYRPERMNELFPPDEYDLVFGDRSDVFDLEKAQELSRLLDRRVRNVDPELVLHASTAKRQVATGDTWASFMPAGALEVFLEIGGPARLPTSDA